jgi:hypothetical protein
VLINLVPDFLAALRAADPLEAYHRYFESHRAVLNAYWNNYVLDPSTSHAEDVIIRAITADRRDLVALLEQVNVEAVAEEALTRCKLALEVDRPVDLYLMVGVGAANAGELVVDGRPAVFVALEHFTGRSNSASYGLGLSPTLLPLWIAHEVAHTVRYCSPGSQSELRRVIAEAGGYFNCWDSASHVPLRELLVNEGLAVAAARHVSPGLDPWHYFGYSRRQYRRLRELDAFLRHVLDPELDACGVGYRLRYLSGGLPPAARVVGGKVIPERSGYYLGHRMVEAIVNERGLPGALRASATECRDAEERALGAQTA